MTEIESMTFEEFTAKEALKTLIECAPKLDKEKKEKLKEEIEKLKQFLEWK